MARQDLTSMVRVAGQLELFDPPQARPNPRTVPATKSTPRWTRYKAVHPYRCDFCVLNQVEDPNAPVALKARWRRQVPDEDDRFLCARHASDQRVIDGMKPLRGAS